MRGLLLLLGLLLGGASPTMAALLEGRVVQGDAPLAGMRVEAYAGLDFSGAPLAISAPTAADGRYRLELPPGRYALVARDPQRRLFALCGRNPVAVTDKDTAWAGLQAVPQGTLRYRPYEDAASAAVEGRVLYEGQPLADAVVYLYLDVADDLKGQGFRIAPPTGADGVFAFDGLPESSYFLAARRSADGGRVGPVLEGDYLALYSGNPLPLRAGEAAVVELHALRKVREEAGSATFSHSGTLLRGIVVDATGRPVAGVHVFAYRDRVIGHQRPAALSAPTGADGVFSVAFDTPGTYFIGARQYYGDSPAPGELFGMYDASADHGLAIEAETAPEPIRIVVEPVTLN